MGPNSSNWREHPNLFPPLEMFLPCIIRAESMVGFPLVFFTCGMGVPFIKSLVLRNESGTHGTGLTKVRTRDHGRILVSVSGHCPLYLEETNLPVPHFGMSYMEFQLVRAPARKGGDTWSLFLRLLLASSQRSSRFSWCPACIVASKHHANRMVSYVPPRYCRCRRFRTAAALQK